MSMKEVTEPDAAVYTVDSVDPVNGRMGAAVYFTDGSVDPVNGRTGSVVVTAEAQLSWRTSDHCSSPQMELVAILYAFEHTHHLPEETVIIYTDSQVVLVAQQQPHHRDNVWLITSALGSLHVYMYCIPSLVEIRGNEAAEQANTGSTITRHVPPSRQQVKAHARHAAAKRTRARDRELEANKRQASWYAIATC